MAVIVLLFLSCILIAAGILYFTSPGKPIPLTDKNGNPLPASISEKVRVTINGVEQGMFMKGKDTANPVLLFLHGGMPEYFLTRQYPTGLEDYFTVVWWEQRGSGLSYSADIPPETMTTEQMVADAIEITKYLRRRFGREKIYLMAHSGGTFIGLQAAARAPELFTAYLGVAQITDQRKSEKAAYEYMLRTFKESDNRAMVRTLEEAPVTLESGTPDAYLAVRDEAMHSLGVGTTRDMHSVFSGIFIPSLIHPEYTLLEKINMWRGKSHAGVSVMWNTIMKTDLSRLVPELRLPVYFFHGVYDYTVTYAETRSYYEKLSAPRKAFYTFEHSAHSPMFEEPERMQKILRDDVLTGGRGLSD